MFKDPSLIVDDYGLDIFMLERELEIVRAETNAVIAEIFGGAL